MKCPNCSYEGQKFLVAMNPGGIKEINCMTCKGTNEVSENKAQAINIGRQIRAQRVKDGETIRQRAMKLGVKPTDLNAVEQGDITTFEQNQLFCQLVSGTVLDALAAAIMEKFE